MGEIVARDATMRVAIRGKSWELPKVLPFWTGPSGIAVKDWYFYAVIDFRPPKKGEYYLGGGPVEVWKAPNDLSTSFLVVQKTDRAIRFTGWEREKIT
jgi:hypothetical protein